MKVAVVQEKGVYEKSKHQDGFMSVSLCSKVEMPVAFVIQEEKSPLIQERSNIHLA